MIYALFWAVFLVIFWWRPDVPLFIYRTKLALKGEHPSPKTPTEEDEE